MTKRMAISQLNLDTKPIINIFKKGKKMPIVKQAL